jgi:hypothetical protein
LNPSSADVNAKYAVNPIAARIHNIKVKAEMSFALSVLKMPKEGVAVSMLSFLKCTNKRCNTK